MVQLIINADDYCRTSLISKGILEAHLQGVVSSTTCMMNLPNSAEDIDLALQETPDLGLGVHLVLTYGSPLSPPNEVATLLTAANRFPNRSQFLAQLDSIDPQQVKMEWQRQIEKFISLTGRKPTHLDSHHHAAYYTKRLSNLMMELAQEYGCALRHPKTQKNSPLLDGLPEEVKETLLNYAPALLNYLKIPTTDNLYTSFFDQKATKEELIGILNRLPKSGLFELMCHPGYSDAALEASSSYNRQREQELAVLTDPEIQETIEVLNIELTTFAVLQTRLY